MQAESGFGVEMWPVVVRKLGGEGPARVGGNSASMPLSPCSSSVVHVPGVNDIQSSSSTGQNMSQISRQLNQSQVAWTGSRPPFPGQVQGCLGEPGCLCVQGGTVSGDMLCRGASPWHGRTDHPGRADHTKATLMAASMAVALPLIWAASPWGSKQE